MVISEEMKIKSLASIILLLLINNINLRSSTAFIPPPPPTVTSSRKNITTNKIMNTSSTTTSNEEEVVTIGPDLNSTRSKMDKKLYRHVTLSNGLKCVLICDTTALRQRKLDGYYEDDEDSNESKGDDSDGEDSDGEEEDDDDGLRKAATALLVNVGSYHDPPYLQGLAHFCEHM